MEQILNNKRILVTQSDTFMGPAICKLLKTQGADVIAHVGSLVDPSEPSRILAEAGEIDVLVANLAISAPSTPAEEVTS